MTLDNNGACPNRRAYVLPDPGVSKRLLALDPAIGSVFVCAHCRAIHVQLASLDLRLSLKAFQDLVVLLNRGATNFEGWLDSLEAPQ